MDVKLLDNSEVWDSWVTSCANGNVLQAYEWGEFKSEFGWRPLRLWACEGDTLYGGAQLLIRQLPIGKVVYVPRGPLLSSDRPEAMAKTIEAIHQVSRKQGAFFAKIEPPFANSESLAKQLSALGLRQSDELQPRSTLVVDLRPDLRTISARLNIKTRYNIGLAGRKGVTVSEGTEADLPTFYRLLQETCWRRQFSIHSLDYYRKVWQRLEARGMAQLLLASHQSDVLAAAMIFVFGKSAYYMYGASTSRGRNLKPAELLQWEAMKWAKSEGCLEYDLWGIPDEVGRAAEAGEDEKRVAENAEDGQMPALWGVYQFKRGFGGQVVRFVGALDYVYSPARYWLWMTGLPYLRYVMSKARRPHSRPQLRPRTAAAEGV